MLDPVDSGIQYGMGFVEWEAGVGAGLDMWKWETSGGYPNWFKAKVVAWWKYHNMISTHQSDAEARKMRRDSKRRNRG